MSRLRRKFKRTGAPIVLLYAPQGCGKTTAAMTAPAPVLFPMEEGMPSKWPDGSPFIVDAYEQPDSYNQLLGDIAEAANDPEFQTLVFDAADSLERLINQHVCDINSWGSIEEPGYGAGYVAAADEWFSFMRMLREINKETGKAMVIIAHSDVSQFSPPGMESYSRYNVRLHKKSAAIVQDECDIVAFMNHKVDIKKSESGFGKKSVHAEGGGTRYIGFEDRPAYSAKNRYGIPPMIYLQPKAQFWPVIEEYLET